MSDRRFSKQGHDADTAPRTALVYFTREACRRIWRARRTSSVAMAMIAIALFILGFFLLLADNLRRTVDQWEGTAKITIYLRTDTTPEQIAGIDAWLRARPFFAQRTFVTREEAMRRFKSHFNSLSGLAGQLEENPFPPMFDIAVTDATVQSRRFDDEISLMRGLAGVDDVQFDWAWIARVKNMVRMLNLIGLIAGGVLAVAAAFTTANVIRLSMVLYREEISIMRLVGANESMVRGPFLLQGILQGLIGAIVALLFLYGAYAGGRQALQSAPSLLWNFVFTTFLPWQKIAYILLGGTSAGLIGSWFSLSEFNDEELAE